VQNKRESAPCTNAGEKMALEMATWVKGKTGDCSNETTTHNEGNMGAGRGVGGWTTQVIHIRLSPVGEVNNIIIV